MGVSTFQVYDFTSFFNNVFKLDANGNDPLTYQFEVMGYNSKYIIINFGTLCWTLFYTPLVYFGLRLVVRCGLGNWFPRLNDQLDKEKNSMFYNAWIQLLNETFLFLGTCGAINLSYLYFNNYGNAINSLLSVAVLLIISVFPVYILCHYLPKKNYDQIFQSNEIFLAKYGAVLEDLNFKRMGK